MSEAHVFANLCPYFSVFDLERFIHRFSKDEKITEAGLLEISHFKAADWLQNNSSRWAKHRDIFPKNFDSGVALVKWGDPEFPPHLKTLSYPPPLLFIKGEIKFDIPRVAIVGARNPTHIGRLWVQRVVPELIKHGIEIVSGGARGIDAEAHWATLEAGGSTIAFLPGSVEKPYPRGNKIIFDRIAQNFKNGALVSEYGIESTVRAENFHRRNRLIAGLADLTIIVEAAEKSGTIMTANKATAENREILVVPGPPLVASYAGSLDLIYHGAGLVRDEKDIIFSLMRKNVLKLPRETPTLWS